jgi:hypothetical protein
VVSSDEHDEGEEADLGGGSESVWSLSLSVSGSSPSDDESD